jgi:hypothetical protein
MGPMFGSLMTKYVGYRYCCDAVAMICLVYSVAYYVICDGYGAYSNSRWRDLKPDEK